MPSVLSASTLTVVLPPGASRTCPGLTASAARVLGGKWTGPAPNDGGASAAAVPQAVFGVCDRVKSSSCARVMSIQVRFVERPSTCRALT